MQTVTFTGTIDNGRACYQVEASAEVDTSKDYLTNEEIISIVEALQRADRRLHGHSYRGQVTHIQVSEHVFVEQEDNDNIYLEDGASEYTYKEGTEWLNGMFADRTDIEKAIESMQE